MCTISTLSHRELNDDLPAKIPMKETAEFRIVERFASRLFADDEGKKLGWIRKVQIATNDPRFGQIGELNKEIKAATKSSFFYGWTIRRRYTNDELAAAACFHLIISSVFEPAGEDCGTKYDDHTACPNCGTGAQQVSGLILDLRKAPKGVDIARTIANEWIVSQRLAERMFDADLTGFKLLPVQHKARHEDDPIDLHKVPTGREIIQRAEALGALHPTGEFTVWLNRRENRAMLERAKMEYAALKGREASQNDELMPLWYQLVVTSADAEVTSPTRAGIDPFDRDSNGKSRCPKGDLIGSNLLSEVTIKASSRGDADIACSRQYVGVRRGVLRPAQIILVSPRFRELVVSERLKGIDFEVAHLN
jgi:hypothetical protein